MRGSNATNDTFSPAQAGKFNTGQTPPGDGDDGASACTTPTPMWRITPRRRYDSNILLPPSVIAIARTDGRGTHDDHVRGIAHQPQFHTAGQLVSGNDINARPTTKFIVPYLTSVGELAQEADRIDVESAWQFLCRQRIADVDAEQGRELGAVLEQKQSLLLRPIKLLMSAPHLLAGWLSVNRDAFAWEGEHVSWAERLVLATPTTF